MYKIKRSVIIIFSILLCISIVIIILLILKDIFKISSNEEKGNPYFVQYKSYVAAPTSSNYTIGLVYFVNKNLKKEVLSEKDIERIEFFNINNVKVDNFKIVNGDTSRNYKIRTLSLSLNFMNEQKDITNSLVIYFKNGHRETYSIGNWKFDISKLNEGNHLRIGNKYPIATSSFGQYILSLDNLSDKYIKLNKIIVDLPNIEIKLPDITIEAKKSINQSITIDNSDRNDTTNIYYIKPRLEYNIEGQKFVYYPYGVYFGILNLTDEVIEKEVQKTLVSTTYNRQKK